VGAICGVLACRYKKREAGKCVKAYSESDLSAILVSSGVGTGSREHGLGIHPGPMRQGQPRPGQVHCRDVLCPERRMRVLLRVGGGPCSCGPQSPPSHSCSSGPSLSRHGRGGRGGEDQEGQEEKAAKKEKGGKSNGTRSASESQRGSQPSPTDVDQGAPDLAS